LPLWILLGVTLAVSPAHADTVEECASGAEQGFQLRKAGSLNEARAKFVMCAKEICPKIVNNDCRVALRQLEESGPHLFVKVASTTGTDLPNPTVLLDGQPITKEQQISGILVDPGTHRLRAEYMGYEPASQDVVTTVADGLRTVQLVLKPIAAADSVVPSTSQSSTTQVARQRTPAYVVGGIGLASLLAGGILSGLTYAKYNDLKSCSPRCDGDRVSAGQTQALVGDVLLGLGAAALITTVVLWVTAPTATAKSGLARGALAF
jgi:hypothetical protein